MVMGPPFNYERVERETRVRPKLNDSGKPFAWWSSYLQLNGFQIGYKPLSIIPRLAELDGRARGMLVLQSKAIGIGHVVAIDELGIVDPGGESPDHMTLEELEEKYAPHGFVTDSEFLAVVKVPQLRMALVRTRWRLNAARSKLRELRERRQV
jgi:hypothetical protein